MNRRPSLLLTAAASLGLLIGMVVPTYARPSQPNYQAQIDALNARVTALEAAVFPSPTPVPTPTLVPTPVPTPIPTPVPTPTPTSMPSPTLVPTPSPTVTPTSAPTSTPVSTGDYLLIDRSALLALPTSGSAWSALVSVADASLGSADLCDQNNKHDVRTLGVALVYARTGQASYRTKARDAIMAAIGTQRVGCSNAILSLGRQLGAYVLAADLIDLSGSDDATFRAWLTTIRSADLGGHGRWHVLDFTAGDSSNNWGAFAQASLVAADAYLGVSLAADWSRFLGFTGDRSAHVFPTPSSTVSSWICGQSWTPVQRCAGDPRDGAVTEDAWRSGSYPSISETYVQESMQGLAFAAEILSREGYPAWPRLAPLADFATRWGVWNASSVGYHLPAWYNARLGLSAPEQSAGFGRLFGYTDWLYP